MLRSWEGNIRFGVTGHTYWRKSVGGQGSVSPYFSKYRGGRHVLCPLLFGVDISLFAVSCRQTQRFTLLLRRTGIMPHCENLFHSLPHAHPRNLCSLHQFSRNLVSEFSGKFLKLLPPDVIFQGSKVCKIQFRLGPAPDPAEKLTALHMPPSWHKGAYF